ncbi:39S ribosomal protein L10, mitochondrial-like [Lytechinus variegatus]|uniref:39S ribosomal protein L10, mitochondrial-like n=1 Tax=Lytechinus variegatus TaxID=7654 RepID=UPI001BB13E89|nr:39S ribosomal protein L10, mitochondrial-like [Lytechinus variegatus]
MATLLWKQAALLIACKWTPSCMCVRTMKSVNTRKKKPMHIMRAKLMALTERKERPDPRSLAEQCSMRKSIREPEQDKPHLVREFYARLCRQVFASSKLIAVFHSEGLSVGEQNDIKRRLRKNNILLKVYGNSIVQEAISGTDLENMRPLFVGPCIIAVSEELPVKELLKATRRIPKLHLLGGRVGDQLMSPKGMEDYSKLPSLEILQGQFAGLLTSSLSQTYSLLQANQQRLTMNLDQLVKQGGDSGDGTAEDR